ncbi:HflX-like GTP-binding protein, partial [Staphylococcus epidermidis]
MHQIKSFIQFHHVDLLLTNDQLTTPHSKTLNHNFPIKIIHTTQLILHIFPLPPTTTQPNLQLELPQLDY